MSEEQGATAAPPEAAAAPPEAAAPVPEAAAAPPEGAAAPPEGAAAPPVAIASTSGTEIIVFPPIKKKQEEKIRRKDPRSWENVLKKIAPLPIEEQRKVIGEKYEALYNEFRAASVANHYSQRHLTVIAKDRDHVHAELAKHVVARARLENLCRELQKQNKQIKEENFAKIKEEEERRKEVSSKFADKLSDINAMMDENKEKSERLREENLQMTAKLTELYAQFKQREEDIVKMSKQLELEKMFSQATLAKLELEIKAEKEIHAQQKSEMEESLHKSEAKCSLLLQTVSSLQNHIDVYKVQYDEFETTMAKSAQAFDNFKFEIDLMTKQADVRGQEASAWKSKFHDTMKALVEMRDAKCQQESYVVALERKVNQLQKLSRHLQNDRTNYLKLLITNGIEPSPSAPQPEEQPQQPKKASPKPTKKEKQLVELKENLKVVQDELSRLQVVEESQREATKPETDPSAKNPQELPEVEPNGEVAVDAPPPTEPKSD